MPASPDIVERYREGGSVVLVIMGGDGTPDLPYPLNLAFNTSISSHVSDVA